MGQKKNNIFFIMQVREHAITSDSPSRAWFNKDKLSINSAGDRKKKKKKEGEIERIES